MLFLQASSKGKASVGKAGPVPDAGWKEVVRKSKKVSVPSNAISRVIGRGGSNINAIRELSGAHIEVEKQSRSPNLLSRSRKHRQQSLQSQPHPPR